jgi:hypothetical protein
MAFIVEDSQTISFAEYDDVFARDQRLFDANESLTDDVVEPLLIRATERILSKLRSSEWWRDLYLGLRTDSNTIRTVADIPALDADNIIGRTNDFTDLCVYVALSEFILPLVADFGDEDNAERRKMGYYSNKADDLFRELIIAGDWYDFDEDGTVQSSEKEPGFANLKRVR